MMVMDPPTTTSVIDLPEILMLGTDPLVTLMSGIDLPEIPMITVVDTIMINHIGTIHQFTPKTGFHH